MVTARITGAILTGGRSRRLGVDKATYSFGGRPLALWVAAALRQISPTVWLLTNYPGRHASLGLPLLIDLHPGRGALGGLLTAFLVAETDYVLLAPCDSPFLQVPLLRCLVSLALEQRLDAVACQSSRGLEPLPGLYHRRLQPRLEAMIQRQDLRLRQLLTSRHARILSPAEVARHDPEERSFINFNTALDLAAGAALLPARP